LGSLGPHDIFFLYQVHLWISPQGLALGKPCDINVSESTSPIRKSASYGRRGVGSFITGMVLELCFFTITVDGVVKGETKEGWQELRSQEARDCDKKISKLVSGNVKSDGDFFGLAPFIPFSLLNVGGW
jgi:hypothetical protein